VLLLVASTSLPLVACGGGSNSEVPAGGVAGSNAGNPGQGGSSGSSGAGYSSSGSGGSGSPHGGSGTAGMDAAGCESKPTWTEAVHYALEATWVANTAAVAGSGRIDLWARADLSASGTEVSLKPCGAILPEAKLSGAARLATGGEKLLIEVPHSIWDAPAVPSSTHSGTQTGFGVGAEIERSSLMLLGIQLADPAMPWPGSVSDATASDVEQDGLSGYTAVPKNGGGYVLPPTSLGLIGSAPAADKVYLVSRFAMTLKGKRTSCDAHSGTADFSAFDTHVVGCHIAGGEECSPAQTDFVDQNRMLYEPVSATYQATVIADGATCAEVRAALPP
jgi:hypothetical protein